MLWFVLSIACVLAVGSVALCFVAVIAANGRKDNTAADFMALITKMGDQLVLNSNFADTQLERIRVEQSANASARQADAIEAAYAARNGSHVGAGDIDEGPDVIINRNQTRV